MSGNRVITRVSMLVWAMAWGAQEPDPFQAELLPVLDRINELWLYKPVTDRALSRMIQGYITDDPHARLLSSQENDALERVTQGQRGGIGVMLRQEAGGVVVEQVLEGMPAAQAGIQVGDVITQIDQVPLAGNHTYIQAQSLLEGAIGSSVTLLLNRAKGGQATITVVRQPLVDYEACFDRIGKVGLLTLNFFDSPTPDHIIKAITALQRDHACNALVIDIRDAYGGLVQAAVQAASLFLPYEVIVARVMHQRKKSEVYRNSRQPLVPPTTPIIIIANEQTASAAELFAQALREHAWTVIIGAPTFGKATIQSVIRVNGYCAVKITTGTIKSGKGVSWEGVGIKPDIPTGLAAGPEGRLLVANAVDALLHAVHEVPSRTLFIKRLRERLPRTMYTCTKRKR